MNPYVGYVGSPDNGAVLIFAPSTRDARPVAFGLLMGWFDAEYTDVRVRRLRRHREWLMRLANPRKIADARPHGTDQVPTCSACDRWSGPLSEQGLCGECSNQPTYPENAL